ncbi:MFS transporter [Robertmurraya siralis]|uniref:MFS transporter n=1 Tax=Robertmurraya siralis TaxID=77777 RepID=A0A919WFK9_9BACI|nr:MFS transporter [Robertmurraya siralis]PAE22591.1 MFS transporter [Bacillus sp. 7504-2]GIN61000.1 MFS transporter [Robertmurraya siralis]
MEKKYSIPERSWALYDWANSAYTLVIVTAIMPLYFKSVATEAGISATTSTAYWGYANSIATLIVSILAPILGTIADFKGFKKRFFVFFTTLGVIFTLLLAVVPSNQWFILLIFFVLTSVGFAGANIFYDAFLVDVTTEDRMNKVSAHGYAIGYIGSTIPFIISIAIIILAQESIIPLSVTVASQIAFVITALWWGIFTIPMLKNVEQNFYVERVSNPVRTSFKKLLQTFKNIKVYRPLFLFLLAYFFYIDGVHTVIKMSTAYGSDLGISSSTLLIVLFVTQIVAAPFSVIFGKFGTKYGDKKMIMVGIFIYIFICCYAFFLDSALDFWVLAMLVGTAQGGIQSLSRSYFAKLVPKESSNEFFGFYSIFGKFAAVAGPVLLGITAQITGNTNFGVFSLVVLFIIGALILLRVPNPEEVALDQGIGK